MAVYMDTQACPDGQFLLSCFAFAGATKNNRRKQQSRAVLEED